MSTAWPGALMAVGLVADSCEGDVCLADGVAFPAGAEVGAGLAAEDGARIVPAMKLLPLTSWSRRPPKAFERGPRGPRRKWRA